MIHATWKPWGRTWLPILIFVLGLVISTDLFQIAAQTAKSLAETNYHYRPNADDIRNAFSGAQEIERRAEQTSFFDWNIVPSNLNGSLAPTNDMFDSGQVITGKEGTVSGTNAEATLEAGEPRSCKTCKTVWYRWTAPSNLSMTFETYGGDLQDTAIGVYMGNSVSSLTMLTWNDNIDSNYDLRSRVTFIANVGQTYHIRIYGNGGTNGTFGIRYYINGVNSWKQHNFDGNKGSRKSDFFIVQQSIGPIPFPLYWWILLDDYSVSVKQWGMRDDFPIVDDYDGDGSSDIAVCRPGNEPPMAWSTFWVLRSRDNTVQIQGWWGCMSNIYGPPPMRPTGGDFDGDGKADFAGFDTFQSTFHILASGGAESVITFPRTDSYVFDLPVCADFDGDGITDPAIFRMARTEGQSYFIIRRSSDQIMVEVPWGIGLGDDVPRLGDYDGDGKTDITIWRHSTATFWYLRSSDGAIRVVQWGIPNSDTGGIGGDFFGNNASDLCIVRGYEYWCLADGGDGPVYVFRFGG